MDFQHARNPDALFHGKLTENNDRFAVKNFPMRVRTDIDDFLAKFALSLSLFLAYPRAWRSRNFINIAASRERARVLKPSLSLSLFMRFLRV